MMCGFRTMTAYMQHTVCPIDTVPVIKHSFGSQQRCASYPVCVVLWLCILVEVGVVAKSCNIKRHHKADCYHNIYGECTKGTAGGVTKQWVRQLWGAQASRFTGNGDVGAC